jgi:glucosyl-3-phosphoglycerate synthase
MSIEVRDLSASGSAREWFQDRSFRHDQFADVVALAKIKRDVGATVSLVLPTREVAATVGPILDEVALLNERAPLVDQVMVVDAGSGDGTADVARAHGAEVYDEAELLPDFGAVAGKGDAMWRSLSVARGSAVVFADADTANFARHFIYGLLGPLLSERKVRFVKGAFHRPFTAPDGTVLDDAGRVTELTAKPLFGMFYPELTGFGQPLAGEVAISRDLVRSIRFCTGYAVEAAMMIDVLRRVGLGAMAQVDLGTRHNRSRPLLDLGAMSYAVARAVLGRVAAEGRLPEGVTGEDAETYVHAACTPGGVVLEQKSVRLLERPPIGTVGAAG